MGLRKILTVDDVALHKVCRPVEKFDRRLHKLLDDMRETLIDANGVGLAAPQVGILRRVVLVDTGEEILELVNPELVETSGEQCGAEGCLSVPGKYGLVKRPCGAEPIQGCDVILYQTSRRLPPYIQRLIDRIEGEDRAFPT